MRTSTTRLPARMEIELVLGFLVFAVFTWSIRGFLLELPSFLLYYGISEIFGVFCYMMAFAFVESLFVMGLLLFAAYVFPQKWFRRNFSHKATAMVLVIGAAMIVLQNSLTFQLPPLKWLILGVVVTLLILVALSLLLLKVERLRSIFDNLLERFRIFSYIYIPLGIIGLLVVIVRNLV